MDKSIGNKGIKEKLGVNFNKPLTVLLSIAAILLTHSTNVFSENKGPSLAVYNFTNGPESQPAGWDSNRDVGVSVDSNGRNRTRCLAISTYWKNSRNPEWYSPVMEIGAGYFKVSCWMAFSYLNSPDPSYGPAVYASEMDGDKKVLRRVPVIFNLENYPGNYGGPVLVLEPAKRNWQYCEADYSPGPGTKFVKWIFAINKKEMGAHCEAWLEDLCVSRVEEAKQSVQETTNDIRLNVNTEFTLNLFWPEDLLLFDVSIYHRTPGKMNPIDLKGMKLRYVVRDYDDFVLLKGEDTAEDAKDVKVSIEPEYYLRAWNRRTYVKTVRLPESIKSGNIGRYMKIKFTLVKNGKEIVFDEKGFGIITQRYLTAELAEKSKFGGSPGPERYLLDFKRPPVHQQLGLTWIRVYVPGLEEGDQLPEPNWGEQSWPAPDGKYFTRHPYSRINACIGSLYETKPKEFQTWMRHVATQARKSYGDRVKLWLIQNENVLATPNYDKTLKPTYGIFKEICPDASVGIGALSLAGMPSQSESLANFFDKGVLDYCDWLDEHAGRAPEEWENYYREMKEELAKRGKTKKLIATEFDTDGCWAGMEKYCRDMIQRHAGAFYGGLDVAEWFVFSHMDIDEDGREFTPDGFDQYIYMRDHRPQVCLRNDFTNSNNFYPRPATFTLYNLTRSLDYCKPKEKLNIGTDSMGYLFDVEDHSVAVVWQNPGRGSKTVGLSFDSPSVKVIDMVGRSDVLYRAGSAVGMTLTERPQILVFPTKVSYVRVSDTSPLSVTDEPLVIAKGDSRKLVVSASGIKGVLRVDAGLDWTVLPRQISVDLKAGQRKDYEIDIMAPSDLAIRTYPVKVYLESDGRLLAALTKILDIREQLDFDITTIPLTANTKPAIVVKLCNSGRKPVNCLIKVKNPVTNEPQPVLLESKVKLNPGTDSEVRFPVDAKYVNRNQTYTVNASVTLEGSGKIIKTVEVGFAGAVKMKKPPVIDGDISEWDKNYPLSLGLYEGLSLPPDKDPFAWDGYQGRYPWKGLADLSGQFYIGWDEQNFYMAVEVQDDKYVNDNVDGLCWNGDAIEVGMYPSWKFIGSRFSDEAFAKTRLGDQAFRGMSAEGGGPSGIVVKDVKLAIRVENGKRTYEFAWPLEAWKPLEFKPFTKLRLNVLAMEEDFPGGPNNRWQNRWICWFPGLSYGKDPKLFGLITLVP